MIWLERTLKFLTISVCGTLMGCQNSQSKAIDLTVSLNRLLQNQKFDQAKEKYSFDFDTIKGIYPDFQILTFSGTRVYPARRWANVEVRFIIQAGSTKMFEKAIWDLHSTDPRLREFTITPVSAYGDPS